MLLSTFSPTLKKHTKTLGWFCWGDSFYWSKVYETFLILNIFQVVAHEMGHNMGMLHDFDEDHGGSNGPCDGTGIMSYGSAPNVWSTCSRADFLALYNQIIASSSWNWCLTGKINNFIIFFPNIKLELNSKSIYYYRGCYCLRRYCSTPRTNNCPTTYHSCTPTTNRLIIFC